MKDPRNYNNDLLLLRPIENKQGQSLPHAVFSGSSAGPRVGTVKYFLTIHQQISVSVSKVRKGISTGVPLFLT